MSPEAIERVACLLMDARQSRRKLSHLPAELRPRSAADAIAIQDATVKGLGEPVLGWKASFGADGELLRAPLLKSHVFTSPACIAQADAPTLGVEAEIAFRFEHDMPARDEPYSYAEIAAATTAFVAIEVVDSRYANPGDLPQLCRVADCFSNGAFVAGTEHARWGQINLSKLIATLWIDGSLLVRCVGGNPAGDPLLPAVALVNALRTHATIRSGQVVTTGSHTGMNYARPGQTVTAVFDGLGSAEVCFS